MSIINEKDIPNEIVIVVLRKVKVTPNISFAIMSIDIFYE